MDKERSDKLIKQARSSRFELILDALGWLVSKLLPRLSRKKPEEVTPQPVAEVDTSLGEAEGEEPCDDDVEDEEDEDMSGQRSRRKGARFERELVHRFREVMPDAEVRRGLQMRSGEEVPDVDCPVFWVEAKRGKKPNIRAALRQAREDADERRMPIAVVRDDREDATVTMLLDDFLELVEEWWSLRSAD